MHQAAPFVVSALVATYMPMPCCTPRPHATPGGGEQRIVELWQPLNVRRADLVNGPWGPQNAPDPNAPYRFVKAKTHGISPGLTVRDPDGLAWSVKQGDEGPVEVALSRVLSAIGYHQPPVYFLRSFRLDHGDWIEHVEGGRFRPHDKDLKERGEWSWQENPFVGTAPYQGLLVVLMMFNSSDLKNSNNSIYELKTPREGARRWFVVRDLGTALGETGRLDPQRSNPDFFGHRPFITGVKNGFVQFDYHGWHQELLKDRISVPDVRWACDLIGQLSDQQWRDAFQAGGFRPDIAGRFIARIKEKIAEGRQLRP